MTTDQKVDVLALLNRLMTPSARSLVSCIEVEKVYDAMAELIEAVKENRLCLQEFANDASQTIYIRFDESERRLLKALDRVGGAS